MADIVRMEIVRIHMIFSDGQCQTDYGFPQSVWVFMPLTTTGMDHGDNLGFLRFTISP